MEKTNKERVRDVLVEHVGKENAITSTEIGKQADIPNSNGNSNVRKSVRDLVLESNDLPIGSCSEGYFIIDTYEELCDCTADLKQRREKLKERENSIRHSFFKR